MAYITQTNIENVYGSENVAEWSNAANDGTGVNTSRITLSIAYAESYVEDRFRDGPYAIPFSGTNGVPPVLTDWCARIAGAWLYRTRPPHSREQDRMADILEGIENEMDSYIGGGRKMAATLSGTGPTVPIVVFPGQPFGIGSFGVNQ